MDNFGLVPREPVGCEFCRPVGWNHLTGSCEELLEADCEQEMTFDPIWARLPAAYLVHGYSHRG